MVIALAITAAIPKTQFVIVSGGSDALDSGGTVTEDGGVILVVWGGNAVAVVVEDAVNMV